MSKAGGFITLHRKLLDWEWYKNTNTKALFIHLLLKANYKPLSFEGHKIMRGQLVTSLPSLATETGLTQRQIRVSLDHLIATGEVASKSYPRYRVITVVKYDDYQEDDRLDGSQMTDETAAKRQADDSQMTGKRQADDSQMTASKQYNNNNKGTNKQGNNNTSLRSVSLRDMFDTFWSDYPKKVAKQNALKAWKRIDADQDVFGEIMTGLQRWKASEEWTRDDGRFIPHPATWLNGRRWEDEIPVHQDQPAGKPEKRVPAQQYSQRESSGDEEGNWQDWLMKKRRGGG